MKGEGGRGGELAIQGDHTLPDIFWRSGKDGLNVAILGLEIPPPFFKIELPPLPRWEGGVGWYRRGWGWFSVPDNHVALVQGPIHHYYRVKGGGSMHSAHQDLEHFGVNLYFSRFMFFILIHIAYEITIRK